MSLLLLPFVLMLIALLAGAIGVGVGYALATTTRPATPRQNVRAVSPPAPVPAVVVSEKDFDRHIVEVIEQSGRGVFKVAPKTAHVIPGFGGRPC